MSARKGACERRKQEEEIFAMCEAVRAGERVVGVELEQLVSSSRRIGWIVRHWRTANKKRFFSRSAAGQSWRAGRELRERFKAHTCYLPS